MDDCYRTELVSIEIEMKNQFTIKTSLISACGMNCRICSGYLRDKNKCPGCRNIDWEKRTKGRKCTIISCKHLAENNLKYCGDECGSFPCKRLIQLDKRYRTKYSMSMIDNLNNINQFGIREFIKSEKLRWACSGCGGVINVHKKVCSECGVKDINSN